MKKEYPNLKILIENNLDTPETAEAKKLFNLLHDVKTKGFLSQNQFYNVAMWKSPRPKKNYLRNPEQTIIEISKSALVSDEKTKIKLLTELKGVSIAVASALLTIIDPENYGIIDIRVWQLLHLYDEVKTKPSGQGFNLNDYILYLTILREYAREFNLNVRDIERILFFHHRKIQVGNLYSK